MKQVLLSLFVAANVFAGARAPSEWNGITVDIKADRPVEVSQTLKKDKNGFQRLEINLSNQGTETLTIDRIEIRIPVIDPIADEMDLVYGSSCMGRRPILRHKVGEPQKKSESFMYAMVRLAADQYVFAGSLSWRIFLPVFTLEASEGKLFRPLAWTKTFALLASLLVALAVIPPLAHLLLDKKVWSAWLRNLGVFAFGTLGAWVFGLVAGFLGVIVGGLGGLGFGW